MESTLMMGAVASAVGILALFGGIALLVWVVGRAEAPKKQMEHERALQQMQLEQAVRLKALESGQPLPDAEIAAAKADVARAVGACLVGVLVPLGLAGAAVGATGLILHSNYVWQTPMVCCIWGVISVPILVTVIMALGALARRKAQPAERAPVRRFEDRPATAVSEQLPSVSRTGNHS